MIKKYILILSFLPFFSFTQTPGSESAILPINSILTYQGFGESVAHIGTAEYKIYYDNIDGVLDKPIFFVDGFDPNDSRTIPLMYSLLDFGNPVENLADEIRDLGYDLIILNFPSYLSTTDGSPISGGADFIQRNAFTFINLINLINGLKVGSEENVVIGPSMGGLISRYALRYMEQNTMDHETRLYISFDSPHRGANVPIGLQYFLNFLVNNPDQPIPELAPLVNGLLNSAAAKQMLVDHYLGHLQGGSTYLQDASITLPIGAPNFRQEFQDELDLMGFPQNLRNVSMINGSDMQSTTGSAGMPLIDPMNNIINTGIFGGLDTRFIIDINFAPIAGPTNESLVTDLIGQANFPYIGWTNVLAYSATSESPVASDGLDSAPGGQFDLGDLDDGSDPILTDFVNRLTIEYFNFIPSISALAIPENNWYATPDLNSSPFANTYAPAVNEPHVTITDANVAFALLEITSPPLSVETVSGNYIKLKRNPIYNELSLLSNTTFNNSKVSILDLTGKLVYDKTHTLSEETNIPLAINSGLYILNIETKNNLVLRTKIIVK